MAWVAQAARRFAVSLKFMKRALVSGHGGFEDRLALAQLLHEEGETLKPIANWKRREKYPQHGAQLTN